MKISDKFLWCLTGLLVFGLAACDPERHKQCEWTLEPEPTIQDKAVKGFITVCARNRVSMKQDCRLQATEALAKKALNRKFRYIDLEVESPALPRKIVSITYCDAK